MSLIRYFCLILICGTLVGLNSGCLFSRENLLLLLSGDSVYYVGSLGSVQAIGSNLCLSAASKLGIPTVILLQTMSSDFLLLTKTILLLFGGLSRIVNLEISVSNVSYSNLIPFLGGVGRGSQSIYCLSVIIPKLINTMFHLLHFLCISLRNISSSSCSSLILCSASLTLFVLIHILFLPFI